MNDDLYIKSKKYVIAHIKPIKGIFEIVNRTKMYLNDKYE